MFVFQTTVTSQNPLLNPVRGSISESKTVTNFIKKNPLISRYLALKDWGESPWKIGLIVSEGVLAFERESGNENKKKIAQDAVSTMKGRIDAAKLLYKDIFENNGGENEASLKLRDDISFMENMYNIIEAQVNGLVSRQASWKARVEDIKARYDKQVKVSSAWENIRRKNPWITMAVGAGVGAAMAWFTNGWNAAVQLTQYVLQLGHGNQFILDRIKPMTDFVFGVLATVGGAALLRKIIKPEVIRGFYEKHIKGSAEAIKKRAEAIKKHAALIGSVVGAAAGFAFFASGQLDGVITAFQQFWKTMHTDPNIVKFINPLVEFFWCGGSMIFFGWAVNKLDRMSLAQKEKLADDCEAKQLVIVAEEKVFRKRIIRIIKEKAIELSAKYGYCTELDKEDVEFSQLAESGDFAKLNALHKERLDKIFKDEGAEGLREAEAADSISTDNTPMVPLSAVGTEKQD